MNKRNLFGGASGDSVLLVLVRIVTILLGLVITRILSQELSQYDYGTYSQVLLIVSTVSSLTILGMSDGINYFFCRESDSEKKSVYVSTIFTLQYIVSLIAAIIVLSGTALISRYFNNDALKNLMMFAAVLPFFQNIIQMLQILFVSIGKARAIAVRNVVVSVIRLIAVVIACYLIKSVVVVLLATLVLDVAQILYFVITLRRNNCKIQIKKTRLALCKEIISFCLPMAIFLLVNSLCRDCDKYLIAAVTDTETLAVYTNASKMLPFDIIMASFCTVLLPYITKFIANKDYQKTVALYREFLELSYVTTAILAGAAFSGAGSLMTLLYSEKYLSGLPVFMIYICVDIVRFLGITLILSAAGRSKILVVISAAALLANVALNFALYYLLGVVGPAIATLLVTFVMGIVILIFSAKTLHAKIGAFFHKKYILLFTGELILNIALWSVIHEMLSHRIHYFLALCITAGGFALVMGALNVKRLMKCLKDIGKYKLIQ